MKSFRAEGHGQVSVLDESLYGTQGGIGSIEARDRKAS